MSSEGASKGSPFLLIIVMLVFGYAGISSIINHSVPQPAAWRDAPPIEVIPWNGQTIQYGYQGCATGFNLEAMSPDETGRLTVSVINYGLTTYDYDFQDWVELQPNTSLRVSPDGTIAWKCYGPERMWDITDGFRHGFVKESLISVR